MSKQQQQRQSHFRRRPPSHPCQDSWLDEPLLASLLRRQADDEDAIISPIAPKDGSSSSSSKLSHHDLLVRQQQADEERRVCSSNTSFGEESTTRTLEQTCNGNKGTSLATTPERRRRFSRRRRSKCNQSVQTLDDEHGNTQSCIHTRCQEAPSSSVLHEMLEPPDEKEALQEAKLQVSFAEQTAREMEQVLDWWSNEATATATATASRKVEKKQVRDEHTCALRHVRSQSDSLRDNSLVYDSPLQSEDDSEDELLVYNGCGDEDGHREDDGDAALFVPPHCPQERQDSWMRLLQSSLVPSKTMATSTATAITPIAASKLLPSVLSPIVRAAPTAWWSPPPTEEVAQEQSFAVDAVCSQAKQMEGILAELEDTSVDGDDDKSAVTSRDTGSANNAEQQQQNEQHDWAYCTFQDLPWWDRLWVVSKCSYRRHVLAWQQWLFHVLPPALVSAWLSFPNEPARRRATWMLLLLLLLLLSTTLIFILYTTSILLLQQQQHQFYDDSIGRSSKMLVKQVALRLESYDECWDCAIMNDAAADASTNEFIHSVLL